MNLRSLALTGVVPPVIPPLTPTQLAEMYGGGAWQKGRKKKKKHDAPLEVMVKVLMERTIRGQNVGQIVRLLRQLRVLAMQQPGYISGETLHGVDDPNYYLVISAWESLRQWQDWFNNPERQKLSAEIDSYLEFF